MDTPPEHNQGDSLEAKLDSFIEEQRKVNGQLLEFMGRTEARYNAINDDLSVLKGGYAVNTAFSDASRIANALGYQFISLVPRQEINAFANLAKIAGEPDDEVESFRNADSVLLVQDSLGQPRYLVVEVSYRISGDDIRRARRNAEYLERFITMPSVGAVAGVRLTDNMKREAEANHVEWHQIRPT